MTVRIIFAALMFLLGLVLGMVWVFVSPLPASDNARHISIVYGAISAALFTYGGLKATQDIVPERDKGKLVMSGATGFLLAAILFFFV